jgi:hypothetical protein
MPDAQHGSARASPGERLAEQSGGAHAPASADRLGDEVDEIRGKYLRGVDLDRHVYAEVADRARPPVAGRLLGQLVVLDPVEQDLPRPVVEAVVAPSPDHAALEHLE